MLTLFFVVIAVLLAVGAAELVRESCRRQLSAPVRVSSADASTLE